MPVINRAAPWKLIPHQDAMCLLDAVEEWNDIMGCIRTPRVPTSIAPADKTPRGALCGTAYAAYPTMTHSRARVSPRVARGFASGRTLAVGKARSIPGHVQSVTRGNCTTPLHICRTTRWTRTGL
jgi:predicted hotdog family 3-hydroxylacyl-ACP dehydratase